MNDQESVKAIVREWVRIDNEIRVLNREISACRKEKRKISEGLVQIMRENKWDQFSLKDGQLMYVKKNVKQPITQKLLMSLLSTYYQGDAEKANEVGTYILDNRQETVKESIKRKIHAMDGGDDNGSTMGSTTGSTGPVNGPSAK